MVCTTARKSRNTCSWCLISWCRNNQNMGSCGMCAGRRVWGSGAGSMRVLLIAWKRWTRPITSNHESILVPHISILIMHVHNLQRVRKKYPTPATLSTPHNFHRFQRPLHNNNELLIQNLIIYFTCIFLITDVFKKSICDMQDQPHTHMHSGEIDSNITST